MAFYFRYTKDGKIKIAKTRKKQGISEAEFEETAIFISSDEFIEFFRKNKKYFEIRVNIFGSLSTIKRFNDRKLSKVGPVLDVTLFPSYNIIGCYIGDKYFENFYKDENEHRQAIEYGYNYYGKELMEKIINIGCLELPKDEKMIERFKETIPTEHSYVHFFVDGKEISYEAYSIIERQFNEMLNIRSVEEPYFSAKKICMPNSRKR